MQVLEYLIFSRAHTTVLLLQLTKIPRDFPESSVGISQGPKAGGYSRENTSRQPTTSPFPAEMCGQRLEGDLA